LLENMTGFKDKILLLAKEKNFSPWALEKDYYATWILCHLHKLLEEGLLLRGGMALSKQYLNHHRLSPDLDLTVYWGKNGLITYSRRLQMAGLIQQNMVSFLNEIGFINCAPKGEIRHRARVLSFSIPYISCITNHKEEVKIDIQLDHQPLVKPESQDIKHFYQNHLTGVSMMPSPCRILVLDFNEQVAEKLRSATVDADPRPRDYFDLWHLIKEGFDFNQKDFVEIFKHKVFQIAPIRDYRRNFGLNATTWTSLKKDQNESLRPYLHGGEEFSFDLVCQKFNEIFFYQNFYWGRSERYKAFFSEKFNEYFREIIMRLPSV